MKAKIFKPTLCIVMAFLAIGRAGFAQSISMSSSDGSANVSVRSGGNDKDLSLKMENFSRDLKSSLKSIAKNVAVSINNVMPQVNVDLSGLDKDLDLGIMPQIRVDVGSGDSYTNSGSDNDEDFSAAEKSKSYSKTYPVDGNDKIKLSNQFGKIAVTTWDRHEIKVDVQIRAEANGDDEAQKLVDAVQINDSKNGDIVSFKTDIERWSWGGGNKKHKLTIDYTVYMPAKNDLDVEDSYGAISLPDLSGRVKIASSYGSTQAENLSNPANEIEGSYGSLKVGSMNGGKVDFSYGSVDMEECNNVRADLSYGSFKLGKLKASGEFDLSYVGGFKIEEVASSLKKLNINTSYSGVSMGVASNSNFDFDITTSYGSFNYDDNKVTITSKNPPDGSRHIGTTRNYKGHVGRGGSEASVKIETSYGGVNFD